jgi:hypothetical protein
VRLDRSAGTGEACGDEHPRGLDGVISGGNGSKSLNVLLAEGTFFEEVEGDMLFMAMTVMSHQRGNAGEILLRRVVVESFGHQPGEESGQNAERGNGMSP